MRSILNAIEGLSKSIQSGDNDEDGSSNKLLVKLTPEAKEAYVTYWKRLRGAQKQFEDDKPGYSNFLGKQCGYVGRMALALHLLEYADTASLTEGGNSFPEAIGLETLQKAINLSRF